MRIIKTVIALVLLLAGLTINSAVLAETDGEYSYEISDGTAVITGYSGHDNHLYIPQQVGRHEVSRIAEGAIDCSYTTRIEIPDQVRKIAPGAFYNCETVISLTMGISTEASYGFDKLVHLETLSITQGTGDSVSYGCPREVPWHNSARNIETLHLDSRIISIGNYLFEGFTGVTELTLPENLNAVGVRSFYNWLSLDHLEIPKTLTSIDTQGFGADPIVRSDRAVIVLPSGIRKIGSDAFDINNIYYTYSGSMADQFLNDNHIVHKTIDLDIAGELMTMLIGDSGLFVPKDVPYFLENEIRFSSSDDSILEVKEDGYFLAHKKGAVTLDISTSSGHLSRNINIRSEESGDAVYLRVPVETYYQLQCSEYFDRITSANINDVTYSCEDENVEVSESGLIRIAAVGSYRIEIQLNKRTVGTFLIDGFRAVEQIIPDLDDFVMTLDSRLDFPARVYPEDADDSTLYYYSEDDSVVSTNLSGHLTAVGKGVTFVNIFSRDNNAVARVRVKVLDDDMSVPVGAFPLMVGKMFDLHIEGNDLKYYSSNEEIATVNDDGIVTGVSTGDCYITVGNDDTARTIAVAVYDAFSYGVDLSEWNNYISADNFVQMKRSGIDFVLLRAGYRDDYEDYMFQNNYYNAREAGLDIGVYHYITATDSEMAVREAEAMLSWIEGMKFEYPVVLDIETENQSYLSAGVFNDVIDAYCSTIESAGYKCMIYSFASLLNRCNREILGKYDIWQAHWGVTVPTVFTQRYTIWQFTASGKVPGVKGDVDMNICFYDYPTYIRENHLNGY